MNLRKVTVTPALTLGTLAGATVQTGAVTGSADGAYRAISMEMTWSALGVAAQTGGPVRVGYAHSDYSVTEIKEALEASNAISVGDKIVNEQANRLVRTVGTLLTSVENTELNDGKPIKTRLNWLIPIGKAVNIFAYNDGSVMVTGASVKANGSMWVKDSS